MRKRFINSVDCLWAIRKSSSPKNYCAVKQVAQGRGFVTIHGVICVDVEIGDIFSDEC